jgi:nitrate/nitrite transporter NarK
MRETAGNIGMKAVALVVLLIAAWILFKVVIGVVAAVAWIVVVVLAIVAGFWALNRLL